MAPSRPTRLLLVDDHPLFRRALGSLIADVPDVVVVGEAQDGRQALEQVRALQPDLVLMDVHMPGTDGVEGVRLIRAAGLETRVVMLTVSDEDEHLFAAVAAGANGYLLKNIRPEEFFAMLASAIRGESPVSPAVAHRLIEALRSPSIAAGRTSASPDADSAPERELTARELDVLELMAEGLMNKEIAARLGITEGTVKNHVHGCLEKLHLRTRGQAAVYATRHPPAGAAPRSSGPGDSRGA
jgi:two-component system, NarL family, nitrate/nitrite response regulator NarL